MVNIRQQKRIETRVYNSIEDIAEELELDISNYPEVYWLNENISFEKLGIPKKELKELKIRKKNKGSFFLINPKSRIIFIGKEKLVDIAEEAGHFVHHECFPYNYGYGQSYIDGVSAIVLIEAIGYFCSKISFPERRLGKYSNEIYKKAYGIGEKMFQQYNAGKLTKKDISDLMHKDINNPLESSSSLLLLTEKLGK